MDSKTFQELKEENIILRNAIKAAWYFMEYTRPDDYLQSCICKECSDFRKGLNLVKPERYENKIDDLHLDRVLALSCCEDHINSDTKAKLDELLECPKCHLENINFEKWKKLQSENYKKRYPNNS